MPIHAGGIRHTHVVNYALRKPLGRHKKIGT